MSAALLIFLLCLIIGSVVGVLAGLLGIGGGLIIVPALLYLLTELLGLPLSISLPMAIATSLSTIILTGLSSSRTHYQLGNLSFGVVFWCAIGISVGAIIGSQLATNMPADQVKAVFAVLVMIIATQMVLGGQRKSEQNISRAVLIIIGLITGCASAFMGIGGGALMVPALMWFRIEIKQAIGSAAFCGLIIAVFGTASFIQAGWNIEQLPDGAFGYVYLPATAGIVITSVFTARVGAKITHRINTKVLKRIFAGFLVIVSLRMLLG